MLNISLYKKYLYVFRSYWLWVFKEYFRKDCHTAAASMTLTSLFAIVPGFFIIINILNTFNTFNLLSSNIQEFLLQNLLPDTATTVQNYIISISNKMTSLPFVSIFVIIVVILLMIKKMETTLNSIFFTQRSRPFMQSLLVYWALMTIGPLLLGFGFVSSTYIVSMTWFFNGLGVEQYFLNTLSLIFLALGFFVIYKILPNTKINPWFALITSCFVTMVFTIAKKVFSLYMFYVPTYSVIYGSLSIIPLFILWLYVTWQITFLGPVMIRGMQYMKVSLDFNKEVKRDDLTVAVNILKELYLHQKNLKDGITIDRLFSKSVIADYDKVKKILYALETCRFMRITNNDVCYLNCDISVVTLREVYSALTPTINFKTSNIRSINMIKSDLCDKLDIKLEECFN